MSWWVTAVLIVSVAGLIISVKVSRDRAARRGWREWHAQRRSGALAWMLFRRRQRLPRLTDGRDRPAP